MEIFNPHSNINFLRWRNISIVIALLLMLASAGLIFTKGLNYSLDFTGGVLVEAAYDTPVDVNAVRHTLDSAGFEGALVTGASGNREISVRLQPKQDAELSAKAKAEAASAVPGESAAQVNADRVARDVMAALKAKRKDATLKSHEFVGPQVGQELANKGAVAVIFLIVGIMIYLGIRFEKRFAVAALATEVHDTLVTLGILVLTGRDFDMTVLASVLAVVGYSINDKVVVFDRVRELFRLVRKGEPEDILNRAINGTLSRTIITSLFTGITMIALAVWGGPSVHGFAITMIIGIIIGTLSSIFIASPLLLWLGVSKKDLMPVTRDNPELARRP
ncbi:MAG TPA: protein translocase subunit SecF [Rhodanobacteraceae bacterium]|nr:protein translocase subunit SecF [Rhodanobacteraceae bacterium]